MESTATLEGYHIKAQDGLIGFVSGLRFDDANRRI